MFVRTSVDITLSVTETIAAFIATISMAVVTSCSTAGLLTYFTHIIGVVCSFGRMSIPHGYSLLICNVIRVFTIAIAGVLMYQSHVFSLLIFSQLLLQFFLSIASIAYQYYHYHYYHVTEEIKHIDNHVYYTIGSWSAMMSWAVIVLLITGTGNCNSRPLLLLITAPIIILLFCSLWLDLKTKRCGYYDFLLALIIHRHISGSKGYRCLSYLRIPLIFFGILNIVVIIAHLIVVFIFPLANICISPDECTFAENRVLFSTLIIAIAGLSEGVRTIIICTYSPSLSKD